MTDWKIYIKILNRILNTANKCLVDGKDKKFLDNNLKTEQAGYVNKN